jgi:hypothetical protein
MDGGEGFDIVLPAVEIGHSHAAEADRRYLGASTSQPATFHVFPPASDPQQTAKRRFRSIRRETALIVEAMQQWSFSIGDPTFMGWIVTLAYLAAAALCLRSGQAAGGKEASFWKWASLCLLLLGLNKQLDLQTLLIDVARQWARAGGWYQHRRLFQAIFILGLALAGIAGVCKLAREFRSSGRAVKGAIFGLSLTLLFVLIRAASFHHVDQILRFELLGARAHFLLETFGIAIVALSAFTHRRKTWINGGG